MRVTAGIYIFSHRSYLTSELPSIPRQPPSQVNTLFLLNGEEIADKYRKAIIHYSKYQNAGIIETEACFKAARIAVEQNNSLHASSFLQNVIFINLTLSEQEKIQRFDTLAELYKDIGEILIRLCNIFFFTRGFRLTTACLILSEAAV